MKKPKRAPVIRSSDYQTLAQRIRWLRVNQRPYMTQEQLATIAKMTVRKIVDVEGGKPVVANMQLNTLRRIANALGCKIFINIKSKPSLAAGECQLSGPELLTPPKRKGIVSEKALKQVALYGHYPWKNYRQRQRLRKQKAISERQGSPEPSLKQTAGKPAKLPGKPSPAPRTRKAPEKSRYQGQPQSDQE